jgi:hypothetical protein
MTLIAAADVTGLFIELGAAVVGLALLARLASRFGVSAIPLYLLGGLAFGNGGLVPLRFSEEFVHVGAEIGVLLCPQVPGDPRQHVEGTRETAGRALNPQLCTTSSLSVGVRSG